jgi:thiol-disulfide isomerase/thioredoxin
MNRRRFMELLARLAPMAGVAACASPESGGAARQQPTASAAPPISSDVWLNTPPLAWDDLRGRVVMVEFWTFGCVNCRNVIPAFREMHADYSGKGFVLIGVHSPEFDYERDLANVERAVRELGIAYPVAIDNDFANWRRYRNRYWPSRYLVDRHGALRYSHIGEGAYGETREWIKRLLAET